jgi:hypothetical protein
MAATNNDLSLCRLLEQASPPPPDMLRRRKAQALLGAATLHSSRCEGKGRCLPWRTPGIQQLLRLQDGMH